MLDIVTKTLELIFLILLINSFSKIRNEMNGLKNMTRLMILEMICQFTLPPSLKSIIQSVLCFQGHSSAAPPADREHVLAGWGAHKGGHYLPPVLRLCFSAAFTLFYFPNFLLHPALLQK